MSIESADTFPKSPLPTGTVTFLFSDVEGSTTRWETRREEMKAALRRHDQLLRAVIEQHGGFVFKTVGDEFCAAFSTVPNALAAAISAQRSLSSENWSGVDGLAVRMALHIGTADERDGDYYGPTVNRVARILSAAHGGQVLISGAVADLLQDELPQEVTLRDLGTHRLKDLTSPEHIYQVIVPDLRGDFAPLRSLELFENNLPLQLTRFIGRETEVGEIKALLESTRLVTLVGAGGVGKTRTALQVGADLLDGFGDGVWFVELAPVADPALVPSAIAQVFNIEDSHGGRPLIDNVVMALKDKRALLILDNCEHLVDAAADAANRILRRCPEVKVLATGREALGIAGEQPYRMPSLPVPPENEHLTAAAAMEYAAVALFVERARVAQLNFVLDDRNAATVAEIVRRLDGIALAIELAAPRTKVLSVDQLARRLDERFKLLTGGDRMVLPRQQTLRALIDWSYDLLSAPEQTLLRQLSIFRGTFTLDAANEICSDPAIDDWDALSLLAALVDKSLVVCEVEGAQARYRLLESTRQYAQDRLEETGEYDTVAARHCKYYSELAERASETFWTTNLEPWLTQARSELDNFRVAIDWGLTRRHDIVAGAGIAANLEYLWDSGYRREGQALVEQAMSALPDDAPLQLRAQLLKAAANFDTAATSVEKAAQAAELFARSGDDLRSADAREQLAYELVLSGHFAEAAKQHDAVLVAARALQVQRLYATVLSRVALTGIWGVRDGSRAKTLLRECISIYQGLRDRRRIGEPMSNLAEVRFAEGDTDGALASISESIAIAREVGDETTLMKALLNNVAYLLASDNVAEAWSGAHEALNITLRRQGNATKIAIQHFAEIAALMGDYDRAARLTGYTDEAYAAAGHVREPTERRCHDRIMTILRSAMDEEHLAALLAEGNRLDETSAVAQAIAIPQVIR